ncbi:F-box and leucine-rich repeat protein 2/20 [Dioscorea alata]|uniref:F-box and leucine-rich repeat protein 2/20 n=1 Tax=Dioscorea alata TaxID=55571 RepID=A0ACB7U473_DIOAL|nr:F-box and leucine-rich repeat protein 2/20 [Dioscorea alata]
MAPHHAHITVLPLDLLIYIIDRVPEPADRKSIRLVSRAFHRAECLQRRDLNVIRREALGMLIRCYGAIESLDLSACAGLDDACLSTALGGGAAPGLRKVNLSRASGVRWSGLAAMVRGCPRIESVDLSHCVGVGDREVAVLAMLAGLKELRLDKCLGVSDVGLAKVAVGCPGLEKLRIKWCLEISDLGIKLLANKCQNLKFLDISYLLVTNKSLHSISTLGRLEVLKMVGCYYITDDGLNYLKNEKNCNTLLSVDVSRCHNVSAFGLVSIIEGHKSLRKLKASDCYVDLPLNCLSKLGMLTNGFHTLKVDGSEVSEPRLKIIGANCKGLTKIGLGKCKGVTDENISELVSNCADLKTIDLTCCHDVTDDSLIAIANSCKKLESLLLESCSLITDEGLVYIGTCCPNLQEVDLTDCDLDDSALESLSRCSELMKLKLGLCPSITDDGLDYIAKCEKLQELDLYRCTGIGDDGLAALAYGCKKIRKLNLCYCTRISDQGMKYVSCLPELKDLELRGLTQVTSLGIVAIAFGCKNLTELDLKRCSAVDDLGFLGLARYAINLRQINISYCNISEQVLIRLLWNLRCLQDVKLVHLTHVRKEGFMLALRSCLDKLKKLKLPTILKDAISPALIQILQDKGCRIRWVDKPIPFYMKDSPPSSPDP